MSKLLAYRITGTTFDWSDGTSSQWIMTAGTELETFDDTLLNGNPPYKIINDGELIPENYVDISGIKNWGSFGTGMQLDYADVRKEIQKLLPPNNTGLTQTEINTLDFYGLLQYFLIYDYLKFSYPFNGKNAPVEVDYDLGGLYKKKYFDKGELIKVEYYGQYDYLTNTFDDIVIREERTYYRVNHMLNRRYMVISWFLNDAATIGFTKTTTKYYTMQEALEAGETRRSNITSKLKIDVVGLIQMASGVTSVVAQNYGRQFLDTYYVEIGKYIIGYEQQLKDVITNDITFPWLDLTVPNSGGITIRQYLISELTIDYSYNNIDV